MKKIYQTLLLLALSFAMIFGACACQKAPEESTTPAQTETETSKKVVVGKVRGKVLTNNGDMLIAAIKVTSEDGSSYRTTTNAYGGYYIELAPGSYTLEFSKGIEFSTKTVTVNVESYKTYYLQDVRLTQLTDSYANGWIAGDFHMHSFYSDGSDTIEGDLVANAASGLYFGFLTDHNASRGVPEWREALINVLTDENGNKRLFAGFAGDEITTEFGHFNALGTGMTFDKYEINFTEAERSSKDKNNYAREKMIYMAEQTNRQGYLIQMNHPYSLTNMGSMNYLAEDDMEILQYFDTIEIWNAYFMVPDGRFTVKNTDNQNYSAKKLWYASLNNIKNGGKFIVATSGTDNHDSTGPIDAKTAEAISKTPTTAGEYQNLCRYMGKYAGSIVDYVYIGKDAELTQENVFAAVKAGHSYMTNGPVLDINIDGKIFGDTVSAKDGSVTFTNNLFCTKGMETLRFVVNGETVKEISLNGATTYTESVTVDGLNSTDWILVEVLGDWGVYAISNPFFID